MTGRWKSIALPLAAILNYALIALLRSFGASVFFDLLILVWLTAIPGISLVVICNQLVRWRLTAIEELSLGCAVGLGIAPTIFTLASALGARNLSAFICASLGALLLLVAIALRMRSTEPQPDRRHAWNVAWGATLFAGLILQLYFYNQVHFTAHHDLEASGLFGIDVPYLVGQFASLKAWPGLRDLHQLAEPMYYHDFAYRLIVCVQQLSRTDLFTLTITSVPILNYVVLTISTYALTYSLTHNRRYSWCGAAAIFLLGSFIGTEQGSYALSPSYIWGTILFLNALLLLIRFFHRELSEGSFAMLMTVILLILSRSKITTFAVLSAGLGMVLLALAISKRWREMVAVAVPLFIALTLFLLTAGEDNPLMPGGDFVIGAPLLGYANHLAAILHVSVASINPVTHGLSLSLRSLLIIPYFIFHLARFIATDGRLLVVAIACVVLRNKLFILAHPMQREVVVLLLFTILFGYFLPVMYSPAWYPLAFSFYAPLVSNLAALILAIAIIAGILRDPALRFRTPLLTAFGILLLLSFIGNWRALMRERDEKPRIVSSAMIEGLHFLREHSQPQEIVASRRYDLVDSAHDEAFYLYSAFSERAVVSEGASYGVLLGAVAETDAAKGLHPVPIATALLTSHRTMLDTIYLSHNISSVQQAIASTHARYLVIDHTSHQTLGIDPRMIGDLFFDNDALTIWRVR